MLLVWATMQRIGLTCAFATIVGTFCGCGDDATQTSDASGGTSTAGDETQAATGDVTTSTSTTTSDSTSEPSSTSGDPDSSSTAEPADSSSTSETDPPEPIDYARGIRLDRLTVNQATQVEVVVDGIEVPSENYNTRLIPGRRTLVRGFWKLHATFEPRELIGRLTVTYPDGTSTDQDFTQFVEGEASDGGGSTSFQWLLEPDELVPGMQIRAKLIEPDPESAGGEVSDPPPIAPLAGKATLGLYDVPLEIKVTLVPVLHQFEGCEAMPEITDEDVAALREQLEQNNPIQRAVMTVREPMPYTETIGEAGGFSPMLGALAQLRAADNPDPNEYYYGLIEPCDGYPPGLLGQAIAIAGPPTMQNGGERISTGRWNGSGAGAAETFVHEVGHTQGRRHVRCSGGEAGVDNNYPHPNGRIGIWGFGIYDFELRTPTGGRDYMTYCSNEWVSDYSWEQTLEVIEVLTSFDAMDAPAAPSGAVLAGLLHADGTQTWWTRPGRTPNHRFDGRGSLSLDIDGSPVEVEATISDVPHSDSKAHYVEVDLPAGFGAARTAELAFDGSTRNIDLSSVRRFDTLAQ